MKIFRKIAAVLTAAVMAVSAFAAVSVTASADSIYDTATAISSGKSVSTILPRNSDTADYKMTVSGNGTLKFNIESHMDELKLQVYDSDGNLLSTTANTTTSGSCSYIGRESHYMYWNSTIEKYSGTVSYTVKSGTYYARFKRTSSYSGYGNGKIIFTATYPTSESTAKLNYITINMECGDTLSLGADMTGTGEVTWKSSKPKVAVISETGKVTAKSRGTTVISAKCGKTTKKIKIKVS